MRTPTLPALLSPARAALRAWDSVRLGSACAVCRAWQAEPLCAPCRTRFQPPQARCDGCGLRLPPGATTRCGACLRQPRPWSRAVAAVDYGFPWSGLVLNLKHDPAADHAALLAGLLGDAVQQAYAAEAPPVDLVLPMPLAVDRLRERGHNQSWELARRIARRLDLPARADLLQRWPGGAHQQGLTRAARQAAVRGVFHLSPDAGAAALRGQRVALVDDVMTTGATLEECARTLQRAGIADLHVWVVARTPD